MVLESHSRNLPLRAFRTWRWSSNVPTEIKRSQRVFWDIRSNVHPKVLREYFTLRWILGEQIDAWEYQILSDTNFLSDPWVSVTAEALSSLGEITPEERRKILGRMNLYLSWLGLPPRFTFNRLNAIAGDLRFEIRLRRESIRPAKRYSGYVRTPSAVGSKRSMGGTSVIETDTRPLIVRKVNILDFLLAESIEPTALGYRPGALLYTVLQTLMKGKERWPDEYINLLTYEPVKNSDENWFLERGVILSLLWEGKVLE